MRSVELVQRLQRDVNRLQRDINELTESNDVLRERLLAQGFRARALSLPCTLQYATRQLFDDAPQVCACHLPTIRFVCGLWDWRTPAVYVRPVCLVHRLCAPCVVLLCTGCATVPRSVWVVVMASHPLLWQSLSQEIRECCVSEGSGLWGHWGLRSLLCV